MKRSAEIFEQVIELDAGARAGFLDRACAGDRAVRAEVESLLDAHDAAGGFLARPTHADDEAGGGSGAEDDVVTGDAAPVSPSRMIGRYKLLEPIGEGGFGAVWMAEQREPVKRRVAVKIIKHGMDSRQVVARFEAERQALAMMDHPNIARVLDGGSTDTGQPYFVMEYIRGVPIIQYCDTERLDTRARLELVIQACHAIQHAHQKGIIHRDIKPSNVMITLHDGVPVVKVIDFGIAKATNVELTTRTLFTQHQQMIGTPAYMSPEQAEMSGLDIDTRSDVYSLGVLLYELLTGTTPFSAEELMSKSFAEMMRILREVEPHRPSTRLSSLGASATRTARQRHTDVARLGTLLRGDLDWIVMKCLEKDRTRRYETATGLADDIRRHLDDEPVAAGPPSAAYRTSKFLKRHRAAAVAAAAVATVLVLGIVGTTTGMLRAIHERERATEVKRLIVEMLNGVNPMVARGQDNTLLMGILDDAGSRLLDGEVEDELIAAELHHVIGVAYRTIGAWDEAGRHLPLALEIRTRRLGEEDPATLESMQERLALAMFAGGMSVDERVAMARRIAERRERVLGRDHPDTLTSMEVLGTITGSFGGLAEAEPIIERNLEARRRVLGEKHRDTLTSLAHLALLRLRQGRLADAEPLLVQSLEARTRALGEDDPDTLTSMGNLKALYELQGRYDEALSLRRRSVTIGEQVLGDRHPYTPSMRLGLGSLYMILRRYEDAASLYEHDVRERRRVGGLASAGGVAPTADEVVEVYWGRGNRDGPTRTALRNLATAYDMIGRRADALALYRTLLEHVPDDAGDERAGPFDLFMAAWVLTREHPEVNDPARAVDLARRSVDEAPAESRSLHMYLDTLALALHQAGATAGAAATERRAIASIPSILPRPDDARTDETVRALYGTHLHAYEASMAR
jgi:tetratricopeptide (TPR) repeat protein/tRNA A-37 threonylcarbamoyl transferase component Bud32